MVESIFYYRKVPRVHLFARFMNLFEPIPIQQLKIYFSTIKELQIEETLEGFVTPAEPCFLLLRSIKSMRTEVLNISLTSIQDQLDGKQRVDVDLFLRIYMEAFNNSNQDDSEWISHLFNTLDFNQDGMMETYEFMTSIYYIMQVKDPAASLQIEEEFLDRCDIVNTKGEKCMSE